MTSPLNPKALSDPDTRALYRANVHAFSDEKLEADEQALLNLDRLTSNQASILSWISQERGFRIGRRIGRIVGLEEQALAAQREEQAAKALTR